MTLIVMEYCSIIILFNFYGDHVFVIITLPRVSLVLVIWYQSKMVRGRSLKIRGFDYLFEIVGQFTRVAIVVLISLSARMAQQQ
jgi:hypothetical protein